ncbi:uncharacterized protein LOC119078777 [Bradysia coprophila]|uniref:uncharacterized protein LOC119078777 n=1 Tax=Bradysia coprophila TaxID=38358 RepID=UPI00187DC532|nr:uncharacterized protein LOC119078777 [Bradysia coprophila]
MQPNNNKFIITKTDQAKQKCTAVLLNFLQHARKLAIGQCITSPIFEMKCANIGHSRWMLIVFPAGQYECEKDNGQLSVYLKMMECEYEHERLLVDVKFFIGSEEKFSKIVQASTFQYSNRRTRWVGTNLTSRSAFNAESSSDNLMRDNDLVIGCRMIHSTVSNDGSNGVELIQMQMSTVEHTVSVGIDALPSAKKSSSPIIQPPITVIDSTLPSIIITEGSSQRLKHKKIRRIFCC